MSLWCFSPDMSGTPGGLSNGLLRRYMWPQHSIPCQSSPPLYISMIFWTRDMPGVPRGLTKRLQYIGPNKRISILCFILEPQGIALCCKYKPKKCIPDDDIQYHPSDPFSVQMNGGYSSITRSLRKVMTPLVNRLQDKRYELFCLENVKWWILIAMQALLKPNRKSLFE